ncbi:hypothetical protein K7X08_008693 [Anisodus acutangulus]|uniref:Amidase domain-containing protein n=1 Tax=Anisodus acutangulus TaxID=402998 RepID=A0A9Q1RSW1_9SOLA|nr:hypothetical protein K7X08_008693 [Anisodus acutangulus]
MGKRAPNPSQKALMVISSEEPRTNSSNKEGNDLDKLRKAGAIILGKASLSEWFKFRSLSGVPNGWCARSGQGVNPYCPSGSPCGSSSGCAISVAANMVAVSLGTETHCSIICPADHNSVVRLKPTVGLTSRTGIIPMTPLWDTVGPICRNVTDAVYMLDVIVGSDPRDEVTLDAAKYIPEGTEPKLIEVAYALEQFSKVRRPPSVVESLSLFGWLHCYAFSIKEATISDLQLAFSQNQLTSRQLVKFYLGEISRLNPVLKGVIEINPDALLEADKADHERNKAKELARSLSMLHGVPILLKDNIATKDNLNTTAGSFSLLGSVVPRDAGIVTKLRKAGVIVLGKASLSEWAHSRALKAPNGWSPRGGQGKNPYVLSADPCGSSSGSAISVAANLVSVSIGTETRGSILCPASSNAVVGIKPTVGLTSRAGVIPITPRQDTVGPIGRTVADAVHVLDAIVGFDHNDAAATGAAAKYVPPGGYTQFLQVDGLKGKRIGIVRDPFFNFTNNPTLAQAFEKHIQTLRRQGAVLVDNVNIANLETILDFNLSGEESAVLAELKIALNAYLKELVDSPVRSLADIIMFNQNNSELEMLEEFGQDIFLAAEATNEIGDKELKALKNLSRLTNEGYVKLMKKYKLDALVTAGPGVAAVLAIGGFPAISVPAAYDKGVPIGICFSGLKGSEPKLIEIAYAFEQATLIRKPPTFLS